MNGGTRRGAVRPTPSPTLYLLTVAARTNRGTESPRIFSNRIHVTLHLDLPCLPLLRPLRSLDFCFLAKRNRGHKTVRNGDGRAGLLVCRRGTQISRAKKKGSSGELRKKKRKGLRLLRENLHVTHSYPSYDSFTVLHWDTP